MLAIGRPLGNMKLVIVNEEFREVGVNEKGELRLPFFMISIAARVQMPPGVKS